MEWSKRDPLVTFGDRLVAEGVMNDQQREAIDLEAIETVDEAVAFADASPEPEPSSLYDDVYVLSDQVRGWYSADHRGAGLQKGEDLS